MIQINKQFSIEKLPLGWGLHESRKGTAKDGKTEINVVNTYYYTNMRSIIKSIIDRSLGNTNNLKEVLIELRRVEENIISSINVAGVEELIRVRESKGKDDQDSAEEGSEDIEEQDEEVSEKEVIPTSTPRRRIIKQ